MGGAGRRKEQARKTAENAETAAYSVDVAFPDDLSDRSVWTAVAEDAALTDASRVRFGTGVFVLVAVVVLTKIRTYRDT